MNIVEVRCMELQHEPDCRHIERFCHHVLNREGIDNWELSVILSDNEFIRNLNREYRDRDEPTDVLSFQQNSGTRADGLVTAGDIVVSLEYIHTKEELKQCIVHGILHLEGLEHRNSGEYQSMMDRQEEILDQLHQDLQDFQFTGEESF